MPTGTELVTFAPGAEFDKKLEPATYYRLTIERGGGSLLAAIGIPPLFGYSLWRPNAIQEAWEKIGQTQYAYAVSPRPAPEVKVAAIDIKTKNSTLLPRGATVGHMVERINSLLGTWARIFAVDDISQSESGGNGASRARTEELARKAGAGKLPAQKGIDAFAGFLERQKRTLTIVLVVAGVIAAAYVVRQFRSAPAPS